MEGKYSGDLGTGTYSANKFIDLTGEWTASGHSDFDGTRFSYDFLLQHCSFSINGSISDHGNGYPATITGGKLSGTKLAYQIVGGSGSPATGGYTVRCLVSCASDSRTMEGRYSGNLGTGSLNCVRKQTNS